MSNLKILVVVPSNTAIQPTQMSSDCDVVVVRNLEEEAHRVRGWSIYRVMLIGLTERELNPMIHDAYLFATADYAAKYGQRPKLQSV